MKIVCTGCGFNFKMYSAGTVNTAPATTPPATPPNPVMITFSSRLDRRLYNRASPIARIEIGIADSITCPTFSPEYAAATVKITQRNTPQNTDRNVSSGSFASAATIGWYTSPFSNVRYALLGSDLFSVSLIALHPPPDLHSLWNSHSSLCSWVQRHNGRSSDRPLWSSNKEFLRSVLCIIYFYLKSLRQMRCLHL